MSKPTLRAQVFIPGPAPDEVLHRASGVLFPARLGDFTRVNTRQYDAAGRDVSAGYNSGLPMIVTLFVYPAPDALRTAKRAVVEREFINKKRG